MPTERRFMHSYTLPAGSARALMRRFLSDHAADLEADRRPDDDARLLLSVWEWNLDQRRELRELAAEAREVLVDLEGHLEGLAFGSDEEAEDADAQAEWRALVAPAWRASGESTISRSETFEQSLLRSIEKRSPWIPFDEFIGRSFRKILRLSSSRWPRLAAMATGEPTGDPASDARTGAELIGRNHYIQLLVDELASWRDRWTNRKPRRPVAMTLAERRHIAWYVAEVLGMVDVGIPGADRSGPDRTKRHVTLLAETLTERSGRRPGPRAVGREARFRAVYVNADKFGWPVSMAAHLLGFEAGTVDAAYKAARANPRGARVPR